MSQHDYIISNDTGANVRSDLNNALGAIATINSGATEPSTTYAYQLWMDTTNNVLKIRNSANSAWYTLPISPVANNTVDINGGTIDGVTLGGSSQVTITDADMNGGTIDGVTIGGASAPTVTNLGSVATCDINGGTVDGITSLSVSGTSSLDGAVIINESGADVDFRIESDTNANGFFLQGSDGYIGIGTSSPTSLLHLDGSNPIINFQPATDSDSSELRFRNAASSTTPGRIAYDHSANAMIFRSNGTDRMRIDSSGRLLVGTTSSSSNTRAVFQGSSSNSTAGGIIQLARGSANPGNGSGLGFIDFTDSNGSIGAQIFGQSGTWSSGSYPSSLVFMTTSSGSGSPSERMRIDSSGFVGIGRTDAAAPLSIYRSNSNRIVETTSYSTVTQQHFIFENNSGVSVGNINVSTTGCAFNTSSDYRLKEDWQPMTGSIDRLKALNPVNFAWISSGERVDGFLAHEAAEVVPEAVSGEKDAVEAIGNVTDAEGTVVQENVTEPAELSEGQTWTKTEDRPVYQGIDQAKLVPLLTAALQEAVSKIEALETRIAALEA